MFTNINSLTELLDINNIGFLYIFDTSNYDSKLEVQLDNTVKIGMTTQTIKTRLSQYNLIPTNISFINCSEPAKRERLLKGFIKEILQLKPVCGTEYFRGCREELEKAIMFFALCDINIINKYNNNSLTKERLEWFNTIDINIIPNKSLEEIKEGTYSCKYCFSNFSLKRTLAYHIKTSKRCIEQRPKTLISCIWCNYKFNSKEDLDKHDKKCEVDKEILYIKILEECKTKDLLLKEKELLLKEKDKEIERLNNIIKNVLKNT